ncbi:MAG: RNA methyltransferase [Sulfuricella sp.]|nr:RNA methyltransferase [Sulfuricella sp.]
MKRITSRDNAHFKQLKKLAHSARERRKGQRTILDGTHLLTVYLERVGIPERVAVADSRQDAPEIAGLLRNVPPEVMLVLEDSLFAEISTVETVTGIAAVIPIPLPSAGGVGQFCLFLEALQDPGNLGSILRSAASAGCDKIYLSPTCVDIWSPKVLRAGMGAHFYLSILENQALCGLAADFPGQVLAAAPGAEHTLFETDLRGVVAFAIGNEGGGLSPELLAAATQTVAIPMPGGMESLNAAAATAICLFEKVRQSLIP